MKINRCPKCGRKPSIFNKATVTKEFMINNIGVEAECYNCGLNTGRFKTRDEVILAWNELTNKMKGE